MTTYEVGLVVLVGILMLVLGSLVTRHYSMRRSLVLVIPSVIDVVDLSRIAKEKIEVLYQGVRIESLWVIRVLIRNRGNVDIEKGMVRSNPRIDVGELAKAIDVEPVDESESSSIQSSIEEDRYVAFEINYLPRKAQAAFQVLAHTPNGFDLDPSAITLDRGIIQNTDLDLVNLSVPVPGFWGILIRHVRRRRKIVLWAYMIFGSACIVLSPLVAIYYQHIPKLLGTPQPTTRPKAIFSAAFLFLYGIAVIVPFSYFLRKYRYMEPFIGEKKPPKKHPQKKSDAP